MNKNTIIGLLSVATIYLVWQQYGKKKPCGCGGADVETPSEESGDDMSCEEAVSQIMAEKTKNVRMTEEAYNKMYQEELENCKNA